MEAWKHRNVEILTLLKKKKMSSVPWKCLKTRKGKKNGAQSHRNLHVVARKRLRLSVERCLLAALKSLQIQEIETSSVYVKSEIKKIARVSYFVSSRARRLRKKPAGQRNKIRNS